MAGRLFGSPLFGVADPAKGINIGSIVATFLGAVVVILILQLLSGRSRAYPPQVHHLVKLEPLPLPIVIRFSPMSRLLWLN